MDYLHSSHYQLAPMEYAKEFGFLSQTCSLKSMGKKNTKNIRARKLNLEEKNKKETINMKVSSALNLSFLLIKKLIKVVFILNI